MRDAYLAILAISSALPDYSNIEETKNTLTSSLVRASAMVPSIPPILKLRAPSPNFKVRVTECLQTAVLSSEISIRVLVEGTFNVSPLLMMDEVS